MPHYILLDHNLMEKHWISSFLCLKISICRNSSRWSISSPKIRDLVHLLQHLNTILSPLVILPPIVCYRQQLRQQVLDFFHKICIIHFNSSHDYLQYKVDNFSVQIYIKLVIIPVPKVRHPTKRRRLKKIFPCGIY